MKRTTVLLIAGVLLFPFFLLSQENKVRVIAEKTPVYAEANEYSYRIEILKKGTEVFLFDTGPAKDKGRQKKDWLYVYYMSPRWKAKVTGFVKADHVEQVGAAVKEAAEPGRVEEPEMKEKQPEIKEKQEEAGRTARVEKTEEEKIGKPEKMAKPSIVLEEEELIFTHLSPDRNMGRAVYSLGAPMEEKHWEVTERLVTASVRPRNIKKLVVSPQTMAKQRYFSTVVLLPESRKIVLPAFGPVKPVSPEFREEPPESAEAEKQGQPTEKAAEEIQRQKIQEKKPQIKAEKIPELASLRFRPKRPLLTISFGYGPSLGGVGGFLQLNSKAGISLHGGVGYYPTGVFYPDFEWVKGEVLYSVGIKYYLPWNTEQVRPYLDLQYGGLSVEAVQVVTGMWYYSYVYENYQKTLRGPSLLAGMELKLGLIGLNSALGLSYVTTEWEYWDQKVFLTADVGILVYF